jgi:hypothetical protein
MANKMTNKEAIAKLQAAGDIAIAAGCELAKIPAMDVLAIADLLTEHEPVKPEFRRGVPSCGKCGNVLANHYRNCPWCGYEVNWNG